MQHPSGAYRLRIHKRNLSENLGTLTNIENYFYKSSFLLLTQANKLKILLKLKK